MNLWVDDSESPPVGWAWARTSSGAIDALCFGMVRRLSLAHDLGGNDTARVIIRWMCENGVWPQEIRVHSADSVGAAWLNRMIDRCRPGTC